MARVRAGKVRVELDGLAAIVAARYLVGAGVGEVVVVNEEVRNAAIGVDARAIVTVDLSCIGAGDGFLGLDPAARQVAIGSAFALDALRELLDVPHA
jgi:hypothetical protein